jgi:hypothetical protein
VSHNNAKLLNESIDNLVDVMEKLIDVSDEMRHDKKSAHCFAQEIHDHAHSIQLQLRLLAEYRNRLKNEEP